jgi:hypothetical protein
MNVSTTESLRSRARGDDGASLVLVMIFVVGVGLVVGALLTYAQTGISSAKATQSRQLLASDASGALDVAINALRNGAYADSLQPCPVDGINVPGASGQTVRVTCQPKAGTGTSAGIVPITTLNRPGSAVLTLGTGGSETGFSKASNGILRIKGRVYVNSNITVSGSACPGSNCSEITVDQAPVVAKSGCPLDKVFSTVSVNCAGTGTPPEGKDPALLTDADIPPDASTGNPGGSAIAAGYKQPPSAPSNLVHQIVPATCPAGNIVQFNPGYYDDAAALSNLTGGKCSKRLLFNPGVYYFDFRNEDMVGIPGATPVPSGKNEWTISDTNPGFYVVGGTKLNWNPSTGTPNSFPGSCVSPLTSTSNNQGVQFVFGGSSRMVVTAGNVELCGQYQTGGPAIVVYGATTGTTVQQPIGALTGMKASSPIIPTDTAFAPPNQALTVDGNPATATIARPNGNSTATASARLTGMDAASQIPAGSILVTAELHVTHREATTLKQDALSVSLLPNPGRSGTAPTASTGTVAVNSSASFTTTVVPLTAALMNEVWQYGLTGVQIDYTVTAAKQSGANKQLTADLDAVQLYLAWTPPSLRGETAPINGSNCVGTVGGCALIRTSGPSTLLYLQGTSYAPLANFDVTLNNVTGQVFKSGIVARSLTFAVTPSASFNGPVIEIPDETGSGVKLDVYLAAYVCTGTAASCSSAPPPSAAWRRVGRSSISLFSVYPVPSNGARSVTVSSWNLLE